MNSIKLKNLNYLFSGKDVILNWQFYDNFDTNGEFWYDANGL